MQTPEEKEISRRMRRINRRLNEFGKGICGACGHESEMARAFGYLTQAQDEIEDNVATAVRAEFQLRAIEASEAAALR